MSFGSIIGICRKEDLPRLQEIIVTNNIFFKPFNVEYQLTKGENNLVTLSGFYNTLRGKIATNKFDRLLLTSINLTKQNFEALLADTKTLFLN